MGALEPRENSLFFLFLFCLNFPYYVLLEVATEYQNPLLAKQHGKIFCPLYTMTLL